MSKNRMFRRNAGAAVFHAGGGAGGAGIRAVLPVKAAGAVLRAAAGVAVGMLAARAAVFGELTPFGMAAVAAAPPGEGLFVLLGAILGCMAPGAGPYALRYIAAAGAVYLVRWFFSSFEEFSAHPATTPAIASVVCFITGLAVVIANGATPIAVVLCVSETLLCGCVTLFFRDAHEAVAGPHGLWIPRQRQTVSILISVCVLLLPLTKVSLAGVSPGRVLGILAILVAARYGAETGGSMAGVAVGVVMSLSDKNMAFALAGYALGGLIAGVFSPMGRFWSVFAFILANAVPVVYLANATAALADFYEVAAATVLFVLLPERLLARASIVFVPAAGGPTQGRMKEMLAQRLKTAAGALEEVSHTVTEVLGRMRKIRTADISDIYAEASEMTCRRCGMRMYCWETAYGDTMGTFNDMTPVLHRKGKLEREDVPGYFAGRCCRLGELLASVNKCYARHITRQSAERRTERLREMLPEEFSCISGLLGEMVQEFEDAPAVGGALEARAREALTASGFTVTGLFCRMDSRARLTVEAEVDPDVKLRINTREVLDRLSAACGRHMEGPEGMAAKGRLRLTFYERPLYRVSFGQAFVQKSGERLCGDAGESFVDGAGRAVMLLSDGMGCGGHAAVDSNLAVGLMSNLVRAGFGFESAARVVNSAVMLKSGDESFATLDIASVDLYTGDTAIFKAGASPAYIRRSGRVERVAACSMPVGILETVQLEKTHASLHQGDLIAIVSDGVNCCGDAWLLRELETYGGEDAQAFAKRLAEKAKSTRDDGHDDDITVMVAVIGRAEAA